MEKTIAVFNYRIIFILAMVLYIFSLFRFIYGKTDWVLFGFSLVIMFLSLWGSVIANKILKK